MAAFADASGSAGCSTITVARHNEAPINATTGLTHETLRRDGTLHATYSYFIPPSESSKDEQGRLVRKAIKHAHFNEAWIRAGTRF